MWCSREPEIPFDRIPDDVEVTIDPPNADVLAPYEQLAAALHDADPEQWRELVMQVVRETSPAGLPPAELDLAMQIAGDHAAETRAELLAFEAASSADRQPADNVQLARMQSRGQWLDQLAALTIPVMTVVPVQRRYVAQTIERLVADPQTVLTDGTILPGAALPGARELAAGAIELLLDRLTSQS